MEKVSHNEKSLNILGQKHDNILLVASIKNFVNEYDDKLLEGEQNEDEENV